MATSAEKYDALLTHLGTLDGLLVAYSGGVDSTLLAVAAHAVLGPRAAACLASSDTQPPGELEAARRLAQDLGLRLIEVETYEMADPNFTQNTSDRCYHCKSELFGLLTRIAEVEGLAHVADGSNVDDLSQHRPGSRAAVEHEVLSPLRDAGLTKADIREVAKMLGLPNWDKPSMACLSSRFPYGETITEQGLERTLAAETGVRDLGFPQVRVRCHGDIARVEVPPEDLERAFAVRERISAIGHLAGFTWVSLDLDGYRSGSMDEVLGDTPRVS